MDRFDYTDGDFCMDMGGGMMMDTQGHMMQAMKIKYVYYTDYITKEKFNQMIPSKIDRINIMIEILKKYNLNEAILRNKSLKYFWEYISHIEEMTVL